MHILARNPLLRAGLISSSGKRSDAAVGKGADQGRPALPGAGLRTSHGPRARGAAAPGGGPANRLPARHLGVAERTVRAHLAGITRKLGVRLRLEVALLAAVPHDALRPEAA
ncbi:LuxR C-terminal-related transcriptional regulator [Streptomyces sp. NPDC050355]|uniref:LuxR C-terminal-related transcriptional regulator n=1 Tax=Streptomyces sp. NPDC050355 TaxID=3365609 RepID=UPI0037B7A150